MHIQEEDREAFMEFQPGKYGALNIPVIVK
jgi:hypothetical protein